ncbi:MAG: insulinase family protein [Gemmatimonadaceae bacterium]|nr:insulinase family protein [Gemmatimonadaceae bacterium]
MFIGARVALLLALSAPLALATLTRPVAAQTRAELERIVQRRVLPNGLEVIVVENHGVPIATLEIDVKNGAFTQTPDYAGLAHMYEHMFFKANRTYPTPQDFADRASELGAIYNGTTQEERVNYYLTLPADSLEGGLRFLAAALREPLDRAESSPFFALDQRMTALLYPGNASRKDALGTRDVLRNVTPAQMRFIQQLYYVPNNCALIVTGDVNPARVFALAEAIFGDWPRGRDPFVVAPIPSIPALTGSLAAIEEAPVSVASVLLQWQGPSASKDPDATFAADVFSDALNTPGSGFRTRLVDSGLWQDIVVNYYTLNHVGPITISGQTTPEKLRAALAALDAEIARFAEAGYVTRRELENVKAQRVTSSAFGIEKASSIAHTIGFWWSVVGVDYFLRYNDAMATQTPADLQRYVRTYIQGKPRVTGVLIAPDARQAIGLTEEELRRVPFRATTGAGR